MVTLFTPPAGDPYELAALGATLILLLLTAFQYLALARPVEQKQNGTVSTVPRAEVKAWPPPSDTAEWHWARRHGHLKSCGLRPVPESADKPLLSESPLPFTLRTTGPEADPGKLKELAQRLAGVESVWPRNDAATRQRYLGACKGDIQEAEKLFRNAVAFIKDHGAERALTEWDVEAYEECFAPWYQSGGLVSHGRKGEPVGVERMGRTDFVSLNERMTNSEFIRMDIHSSMRTLAALEEDALRRQAPVGNIIMIVDMHGFTWENARMVKLMGQIVTGRNVMTPDIVGKVLVVRAPALFVTFWRFGSSILAPGTREKIQLATAGGSLELMRKYVDDDNIPAFLGGRLRISGDPECRTVIAPGGRVPQEAFDRFHALIANAEAPTARSQDLVWDDGADAGICGCCFSRGR